MVNDTSMHEWYFYWLCEKVKIDTGDEEPTFFDLARKLHDTTYYSPLEEDMHHVKQQLEELHRSFAQYDDSRYRIFDDHVTVLEAFICIAQIMVDHFNKALGYPSVQDCEKFERRVFWSILNNLGLTKFDDDDFVMGSSPYEIDARLHFWMNREYGQNGKGGIFPLRYSLNDQLHSNVYDQGVAWCMENMPMKS